MVQITIEYDDLTRIENALEATVERLESAAFLSGSLGRYKSTLGKIQAELEKLKVK